MGAARAQTKKSAGRKPTPSKVTVGESTPVFDAALEASKCDLDAIRQRPAWNYERVYKDMFGETPAQHHDRAFGARKGRKRVGG